MSSKVTKTRQQQSVYVCVCVDLWPHTAQHPVWILHPPVSGHSDLEERAGTGTEAQSRRTSERWSLPKETMTVNGFIQLPAPSPCASTKVLKMEQFDKMHHQKKPCAGVCISSNELWCRIRKTPPYFSACTTEWGSVWRVYYTLYKGCRWVSVI